MIIAPIETWYKSILFRSKLEAKWAFFFDNIGIKWEYEPLPINNYLPDFFIYGAEGIIIVEVKPYIRFDEFQDTITKMQNNIKGTEFEHNEILLLGLAPFTTSNWCVYDTGRDAACIGWLAEIYDKIYAWDEAIINPNAKNSIVDFFSSSGSWKNRIDGRYDGDHFVAVLGQDDIMPIWNKGVQHFRYNFNKQL